MNWRLHRKMLHQRPPAGLVAFTWALLVLVALRTLIERWAPRAKASRRSPSALHRILRLGQRQRREA